MPEYRFYLLDARQVTIDHRTRTLDTDTQAMEEAAILRLACHVVEIWNGPKMIARILGPEGIELSQRRAPPSTPEPDPTEDTIPIRRP